MPLWDGAACMEIDRYLDALHVRHCPATLGSTLGDPPGHGHTDGSFHYDQQHGGPRGSTGQARDHGTACSDCNTIAAVLEPLARGPNRVIEELIWTRRLPRTGVYYRSGIAYTPSLALAWQHRNHTHSAVRVGYHLPILVAHPHPANPQPVEDEMKGRIIQCKPDGPFGDAEKSNLGWFFAAVDRSGPFKTEVGSGRLADELAAYGQISNTERDAQGHIRPYLVDESIFDAFLTTG